MLCSNIIYLSCWSICRQINFHYLSLNFSMNVFHFSFDDAFCYSQTSSRHISLVLTSCFRCEMAARWSDFKFPSQSWKHQWQRDDEPETLNNSQENIHSQNNKRDRKQVVREGYQERKKIRNLLQIPYFQVLDRLRKMCCQTFFLRFTLFLLS